MERAAAGGDPQDVARLLLDRVRRGDLAADRLQLAAYAEHPAAKVALGLPATHPSAGGEPDTLDRTAWWGLSLDGRAWKLHSVESWCLGLPDDAARTVAAVAAGRAGVARLEEWDTVTDRSALRACLDAADAWTRDRVIPNRARWSMAWDRAEPHEGASLVVRGPASPGELVSVIRAAGRIDPDAHAVLREPIQRAVAAWALEARP